MGMWGKLEGSILSFFHLIPKLVEKVKEMLRYVISC